MITIPEWFAHGCAWLIIVVGTVAVLCGVTWFLLEVLIRFLLSNLGIIGEFVLFLQQRRRRARGEL